MESAISVGSLFEGIRKSIQGEQRPQARHLEINGKLYDGEFIFFRKQNEEADWEKVCSANTDYAYDQYLKKYPNGRYVFEASRLAEKLRDEGAWRQALNSRSIAAYKSYLNNFPHGKYVEEAKKRLMDFESPKGIASIQVNKYKWATKNWRALLAGFAGLVFLIVLLNVLQKSKIESTLQEIEESMLMVEGGSFLMGRDDGDKNEGPSHEVNLPSYYLNKFEVTQAQ